MDLKQAFHAFAVAIQDRKPVEALHEAIAQLEAVLSPPAPPAPKPSVPPAGKESKS